MGTYYCAVDEKNKQKIEPPDKFANKFPGLIHPKNPFPAMVTMMNALGGNFQIVNDEWKRDDLYYDEDMINITDDVYRKYLEYYPLEGDS